MKMMRILGLLLPETCANAEKENKNPRLTRKRCVLFIDKGVKIDLAVDLRSIRYNKPN